MVERERFFKEIVKYGDERMIFLNVKYGDKEDYFVFEII